MYAKINFQIHLPPPYQRDIWYHKKAETDLIKRTVDAFDLEGAMLNLNTNDQVDVFTDTLIYI